MTKYPEVPGVIESEDQEYRDSGIESTVNIAGHPIHPLLVTLPIGFWIAAWGFDVGYWLSRETFWANGALWLLGAGLVTGVLAALAGMSDFLRIRRVRKHFAGWAHMVGNIVAMAITAVNFFARLPDPVAAVLPWGLVASTLVAVLLGVTGWWGGELVYRHKVSVIGPTDRESP